jgi:hypothetical protein
MENRMLGEQLVSTLCAGMALVTLRALRFVERMGTANDTKRHGVHSHVERGNED